MSTKLYELIKMYIKKFWKLIVFWIVLLCLLFYRLPYVILSPGRAINLNKRVQVDLNNRIDGRLEMAYVTMRYGNVINVLLSFVMPNWDLERVENITTDNYDLDDILEIDRVRMQESIDSAILVASKKANIDLEISKTIPMVTYIDKNAKTSLRLYDKIISIDDIEVYSLADINKIVNNHKLADIIPIKVLRGDKEILVEAETIMIENKVKIGISVTNTYEYKTNPSINILSKESEIGSSGGVMISLAIYNALTNQDITKGKVIVGTGTIDIEGNVGKIDGVKYKLLGAYQKHADLFICPKENEDEAKDIKNKYNLDIPIIGVSTFDEALELLSNM